MSTLSAESPLATLEKLQGQLPPHLARPDLAELAVLLRYAERGTWAFAVYNTVPVRDEVAAALRELLAPLPVYQFTLSAQTSNPLVYVEKLPHERAVVFFFDLEQTNGQVWYHLEMQRERLAAWPLGLVFWIDRRAWQAGVRAAPNFWSQRGGVFDFTIESTATLTEVRGAWAGQPVRLDSPADWERQMRLYSGLLREYESENAPPATLAGLHGKIAYLFHFAGRHAEAAEHLRQQLELAQAADNRQQQVEAMNNLGRVAQIQQGQLAALTWYEQALTLAGDDPRSRAESLQNMASTLLREGQTNQAEAMLTEALELFRAVGDRLGEANTLRAIGDAQRFKDENEAALGSYGQALELFRAVGDRLGEANTLQAIGLFKLDLGETGEALKVLDQALQLYRQVGDRVGQANIYWNLGLHLARQGALKEAEPLLAEAVTLGNQIAPGHPTIVGWQNVLAQVQAQLSQGGEEL